MQQVLFLFFNWSDSSRQLSHQTACGSFEVYVFSSNRSCNCYLQVLL